MPLAWCAGPCAAEADTHSDLMPGKFGEPGQRRDSDSESEIRLGPSRVLVAEREWARAFGWLASLAGHAATEAGSPGPRPSPSKPAGFKLRRADSESDLPVTVALIGLY